MKRVPFAIIQAAKSYDSEAIEFVFRHFQGYIAKKSLSTYKDEYGNVYSCVDDDLRCAAEFSLLSAVAGFRPTDPPDDFAD